MDYHVYTVLPVEREEKGGIVVGADSQKGIGEISGGGGLELVRVGTTTITKGRNQRTLLTVVVRGEYSPYSLNSIKTPFGTFSVEDATTKQYLPGEENTLWEWEVGETFEDGVVEEVVVSGEFLSSHEDTGQDDIYNKLLEKLGDVAEIALRGYPGVPVVLKYEQGPENWKRYVAYYPIGISPQGRQQTSTLTNLNSELHIQAHYEARVQYTFVGKGSFTLANHFNQQITTPLVREALYKKDLTVFSKGRVVPTPQKRETKWVEGFSVDIRLGFAVETRQKVDTVDTVNLVPVF